jgi:hypothetical protein
MDFNIGAAFWFASRGSGVSLPVSMAEAALVPVVQSLQLGADERRIKALRRLRGCEERKERERVAPELLSGSTAPAAYPASTSQEKSVGARCPGPGCLRLAATRCSIRACSFCCNRCQRLLALVRQRNVKVGTEDIRSDDCTVAVDRCGIVIAGDTKGVQVESQDEAARTAAAKLLSFDWLPAKIRAEVIQCVHPEGSSDALVQDKIEKPSSFEPLCIIHRLKPISISKILDPASVSALTSVPAPVEGSEAVIISKNEVPELLPRATEEQRTITSVCRVLLIGIGADEQLAGPSSITVFI